MVIMETMESTESTDIMDTVEGISRDSSHDIIVLEVGTEVMEKKELQVLEFSWKFHK